MTHRPEQTLNLNQVAGTLKQCRSLSVLTCLLTLSSYIRVSQVYHRKKNMYDHFGDFFVERSMYRPDRMNLLSASHCLPVGIYGYVHRALYDYVQSAR